MESLISMHVDLEKSLPKKITVGIECESLEGTSWGVARIIRKLLDELSRRPELRRTHHFVLYFNGPAPKIPGLDRELFSLISVGLALKSFSIYYYVLLPFRIMFAGLDVMYYPNYMLPIIHPPWVPSLVMLTEDVWHEMRNPRRALRYKVGYSVFSTWAAWCATRIMAMSHASKTEMARLFCINPSRISVNSLAVDPVSAISYKLSAISYLLYVGQAFERRHLRETLLAFRDIAPKHPNLDFVFIGPDKYDPPIIDQLIGDINSALGRPAIKHIEHVSDEELESYYRGALAITYVSDMEAFGLPPLEALRYGVPPVMSDTPINQEIYGNHAFYVAMPINSSNIGATLERAITDDKQRGEIQAAAPGIVGRYTWQAHTDRFLEIIKHIA